MAKERESIVHSSVVTAFTIAAALIWKDVFTEAVVRFVPKGDHLFAQFWSALLATALIILSLKLFLSTEKEAEKMIEEVEDMIEHHEKHHMKKKKKK